MGFPPYSFCMMNAFFTMDNSSFSFSSRTTEMSGWNWIIVLDDEAWSIFSTVGDHWQTDFPCHHNPGFIKAQCLSDLGLLPFYRTLCAGIVWLTAGNRKGKLTFNWIEVVCYFLLRYDCVCSVSRENIQDGLCDSVFPHCVVKHLCLHMENCVTCSVSCSNN